MTKKQYLEMYAMEKNLKDAGLYPYNSKDNRINAQMLNARAALLLSCSKKEHWNDATKDRLERDILGDVGFEIAKAEADAVGTPVTR